MAKNAEFVDKGRRCHACNGPGWMFRYTLTEDASGENAAAVVDFHDTCVGSYLTRHPDQSAQFLPGPIT